MPENRQDRENLFSRFKAPEPPVGLFDRIILAIKREQELRRTRKLLFVFASLLLISLAAVPFSGVMLVHQLESAGFSYFVSAAVSDGGAFLVLWRDFGLALLETLPIGGAASFFFSLAVSIFTLRLFLRRKGLLLSYLKQGLA